MSHTALTTHLYVALGMVSSSHDGQLLWLATAQMLLVPHYFAMLGSLSFNLVSEITHKFSIRYHTSHRKSWQQVLTEERTAWVKADARDHELREVYQ